MISKTTIVGVALVLMSPAQALAQAAVPVGHWATTPPSEQLYVNEDATCSFLYMSRVVNSGTCDWNPTSVGGILTITYPMPLEPGKTRHSIVWINKTTIRMDGDVFHLIP